MLERMLRQAGILVVLWGSACAAEGAVASPVPSGTARVAAAPEAAGAQGAPTGAPPVADPAPTPSTAPAATPVSAPAVGATPPAVAAQSADAGPPGGTAIEEGCVATVDELPPTPLLDVDDRRARRGSLVVVRKGARRLMLFDDGTRTHCFRVALGFAPTGHKEVEGDGRTPEGWYRTSDKPWSTFDHAIAIHYPNEADARAAAADRRIGAKTRDRIVADLRDGRVPPQNTKLGGAVLIHGGGSASDWTLGCVALEDADLLALRAALPRGMRTDMLILP